MQVTLQTLVGGLSLGAIYALIAVGFSVVYRTMGLVNFAHADVAMIGAYACSTFYLTSHVPFAAAIVISIVVTGIIGLIIERVLRPLENKDFDLMLIGTIGFGTVLQAAATLIWGTTGRAMPSPITSGPLEIMGIRIRTYDLMVIAITAVSVVLLTLFLQRTKPGAAMQAVAMDHEAATAVGIHVGRSNALAFAIGAGIAALAGSLAGPMLYVDATLGAPWESKVSPQPCSADSGAFLERWWEAWPSGSWTPMQATTSRATASWSPFWSSPRPS